jgi:hypothetical protein
MQTYSYQPLASDSIRLLSLDNNTSPTFHGTLKSVNLNEAPEYFCLSYTWGLQIEDVKIHIDGQALYIRPSLLDMLHRLRELRADESSSDLKVRWIWIDRICINQDDIKERSEQVRCMGRIYSQAVRTVIWAGPDLDGCSAAWQLIEQIYDTCMIKNPHAKYLADIPCHIYSDQKHAESNLPPWDDSLWEHLRGLFTLPWFTRTWIIQEVALSSLDPIILHGKHRYEWHKLGWAASWLRRNGYLRLPHIPDQLQNCDTISNIRRSRTSWNLDALLATTSVKFKSTDQRDKVFGLLGLAAEAQNPAGLPDALRPDYNLRVEEVYTKVAFYFVRTYQRLPTLALAAGLEGHRARAQHVHQYTQLPTWVPNWSDCSVSNSEHTKGFSWLFYSATGDATTLGFPVHSKASANLPAEVLDSRSGAILTLKVLVADSVVGVVDFDDASRDAERDSVLRAWRMYVQDRRASECVIPFVDASTAGQHGLSGRSAAQIHKDGAAYLLEAEPNLQAMAVNGNAASYASLARNFCHNRSFVVTVEGCVGIGPVGTQPGDSVAVIFGGGVPYVIRAYEERFQLVGEAYIHGLMSGEAVEKWRKGELEEKVVEFC